MTAPGIAYVAVGSNIDPEQSISSGLRLLAAHVSIVAVSTIYRSQAAERPEQNAFLNGVCRIETDRTPRDLKFDVLREIEKSCGRVRSSDPDAARTLDLDLLLYGDLVLDEGDIVIPDPDIGRRPFTALPLLELDPTLRMPDSGALLADIAAKLSWSALEPEPVFTKVLREMLSL